MPADQEELFVTHLDGWRLSVLIWILPQAGGETLCPHTGPFPPEIALTAPQGLGAEGLEGPRVR